MVKYNGHKNWVHWNVSLWLNNDEALYKTMRGFARRNNRAKAAELMLQYLKDSGMYETPDGARYSKTAIQSAMVGL